MTFIHVKYANIHEEYAKCVSNMYDISLKMQILFTIQYLIRNI